MKILFVSDILEWSDFEPTLKEERPDVLLIGGGVLGGVHYLNNFVDSRLKEILFAKFTSNEIYSKMREFLYLTSAVRFYSGLRYASRNSKVLIVSRGDEADAEEEAREYLMKAYPFFKFPIFDANKIDAIENCEEISGKTAEVKGLRFLGIGHKEFRNLKELRPILQNARYYSPHIIVARAQLEFGKREPRRQMICKLLQPKLFISGFYHPVCKKFNNTWIVEGGSFPQYTTIMMTTDVVDDIELKIAR